MKQKTKLLIGLCILPIICYFFNVFKYGINVPHWDDHAIRETVRFLTSESPFLEKINSLFALHNEHRIITTRLFAFLSNSIEGQVNFKTLMVAGNLFLLFIWAIFFFLIRKDGVFSTFLLCISLILFNFNFYELQFWGMASFQNFGVIAFTLACFYALVKIEKNHTLAIIFAILATFTSGNGLLVFPIGAIYFLFKKNRKSLIYWLVFVGGSFLFYLVTFKQRPDSQALGSASFLELPIAFSAYFGAALEPYFLEGRIKIFVTALLGFTLIALFVFLFLKRFTTIPSIRRKPTKRNQALLFSALTVLFIGGTALLVSYSRFSYGTEVVISSKHKIYSSLLICLIILLFSIKKRAATLGLKSLVVLSAYLFLNSYTLFRHKMKETRQERMADLINFDYDLKLPNLYKFPSSPLKRPFNTAEVNPKRINKIVKGEGFYTFEDSLSTVSYKGKNDGLFLLLISRSDTLALPFNQNLSRKLIRPFKSYSEGFNSYLSTNIIDTDIYSLFLMSIDNNIPTFIDSKKIVKIDGNLKQEPKKNW